MESGPLAPIDGARAPLGIATGALLVGVAALVASLIVLGTIADGIRDQEVFALDTWATPFLHSIQSPAFNALMVGLTTIGSTAAILAIFVAVGIALLAIRRYAALLFLGLALGGAILIDFVMKRIFERPRPKLDYAAVLPDYSFPSGHAMNGVAFYLTLGLIAWSVFGRRVGLIVTVSMAVLAFGIGVSRIYLGYHYLTDVVGGWLGGIVWLLVVGAVFRLASNGWRPAALRG
jgi:membrane-associated phospholipid phosphatase